MGDGSSEYKYCLNYHQNIKYFSLTKLESLFMIGYGLPRDKYIENPDIGDIKKYGLKTYIGGKDYFKKKNSKSTIRRYWKHRERANAKVQV